MHGTLVTHHHGDHWKGVAHVRKRHGGPVYAHAWTAPRVGADHALEGGETIELAPTPGGQEWKLEVVFTPGHTPGHLALYEPVSGTIVAGDLVSGLSTVIVDPPEGDMAAYVASLESLLARRSTLLLPAHGPPIGGPRHRLRHLIEHRARPIGWIQWYRWADHAGHAALLGAEPEAAGLDLALGEERLLGRGLGPRAIRAFLDEVVFRDPAIVACVTDPETRNTRSLRAFAKAGFHVVRTVQLPGEPATRAVVRHERRSDGSTRSP